MIFIFLLDILSREFRTVLPGKLLHADNLVLIADTVVFGIEYSLVLTWNI